MNKKLYNFITKIVMSVKKYAKPEALEDGDKRPGGIWQVRRLTKW